MNFIPSLPPSLPFLSTPSHPSIPTLPSPSTDDKSLVPFSLSLSTLPSAPKKEERSLTIPTSLPLVTATGTNTMTTSVTQSAFTQQIYTILGQITAKAWKQGDKISYFTVVSVESQKSYKIACPYFCPAKPGDSLSGVCTNKPDNTLIFIKEPLVEPGASKETVKTSFIVALKNNGQNFGSAKAEQLYQYFEKEARQRIATLHFDDHDMIIKNRDMIPQAVLELISLYSTRFRENASTIIPLMRAGLTEEQCHTLLNWWYNQCAMRRLYLLGLTWTEINASVMRGWDINQLYYKLIENPFLIETVPLKKAHDIANKYELRFTSDLYAAAELVRFIDAECISRCWMSYPVHLLTQKFQKIPELLTICKKDFSCHVRYDSIYLKHQNETENILCDFFKPVHFPETYVSEITKRSLCEEQVQAVTMALSNNISIITGGAGVGKTTVIKSICHEFDLRATRFVIAAFTGKAVARIQEVFGDQQVHAITLHMLLSRGLISELDAIIIDEISMVPNELLARVLTKVYNYNVSENWVTGFVPTRTKPIQIIMVGDSSQISPIEPGDLFNQLLSSRVPKTRLLIDHRRTQNSVLKSNTHQFALRAAGQLENIHFEFGGDCLFQTGGVSEIESIIRSHHLNGVSQDDIIVISPYNEPLDDLNTRARNIFIPTPKRFIIDAFGKRFDIGCKIIMLKNFYDINVMNGQEGHVVDISADGTYLIATFQKGTYCNIPTDIPPELKKTELGTESTEELPLCTKFLSLSYAITIHKSQGSEWKIVVFYMPNKKSSGFLNRNLFYTAISRAKEQLYIVGSSASNVDSVVYTDPEKRHDKLQLRLMDNF